MKSFFPALHWIRLPFSPLQLLLKGAQAWDIRERIFYTNQRPVRVGDLGTGEKKMKFRKLECLFEGFWCKYLIKRMISMRKKIQDSQKKKVVWDALGTLI